MMVHDQTPFRLNRLDVSPGREKYHYKGLIFSSGRRKDYNNQNLTCITGLSSQNQNNSIKLQKTLGKKSVSTQLTFGGFLTPSNLKPRPEQIHSNIINKSLKILKEVNSEQYEICRKFIKNFTSAVQDNQKLRTKLGFSDLQVKSMSDFEKTPNLWDLPEKSLPERTAKSVVSPVTAIYKKGKEIIFDNDFGKENFASVHKDIQADKEQGKIIADYKNVIGIFNSIEKWENAYRKRYGFEKIKAGEEFMMSDEELQRYLKKRTFDSIDPAKGRYDVKHLSAGNRIVSGLIGAFFYGLDAFNTTMRFSNDKKESQKEGKIKFAQQVIRIGLASYFTATALGMFKKQTNRSMGFALAISGITVLASEVLGRMMVGNPILPTSKNKIEEMREKNQNSNNIVLKFGRFLSGESSVSNKKSVKSMNKIKLSDSYVKQRYQDKFFGSEKRHAVSFQAMPKKYKKEELTTLLKLVSELDGDLAKYYKANILKNLAKKNIIEKDAVHSDFDEAIEKISEVEVGEYETRGEKIKKALLAPFIWIKNVVVKAFKAIQNFFSGKKISKHDENLNKIKELKLDDEYKTELERFKKSEAFTKKSKLNDEQKVEAFTDSFLFIKDKGFKDEMQGIQNSLEWLKKNIKMDKKDKTDPCEAIKNILANKDKDNVKEHLKKMNETMNKMSFTAYAKDFADYDTSKYAVANNMVARALSTIFLVFDAFNLTMEHSGDRQKAVDNGTQYATQETTRTFVSSYVISGINALFQSLHNGSLAGAFALTAFSSSFVAAISRIAVGNPLTPKTQQELIEIEKRNKNNPMLKITSRMVGKSMHKMDYGQKQMAIQA